MKNIQLKAYRIEELAFVNKLPVNTKIELSNKYSYNVGYSKINTCRGEFKAEICDKNNPDKFNIKITLIGVFVTPAEMEKEKLHVATYDAIFPYVRAAVSNLTVNAGIPPIMIPYADISGQSIYRVEIPGKK